MVIDQKSLDDSRYPKSVMDFQEQYRPPSEDHATTSGNGYFIQGPTHFADTSTEARSTPPGDIEGSPQNTQAFSFAR